MSTVSALSRARSSCARRAWGEARAAFGHADADAPLGADDLERFALACYLTGHDDDATRAWTRAHRESLRQDDRRRAAPAPRS
jgi:hypothetical protein